MRIVVFGAAGAIGSAITAELVRRGHDVIGVTRSGRASAAGAHTAVGDAADPEAVARLVAGAGAVVSAIGPRHDGSEDPAVLADTTRSRPWPTDTTSLHPTTSAPAIPTRPLSATSSTPSNRSQR